MAKYNYDKSALKGLGVGAFLGEVKLREQHIAAATDEMPQSIYNANILAKKLHPAKQFVKVAKVVDHGDAKSFVLVPDPARGTEEMAYFRAGQYTTVEVTTGGATLWKPYSICSGPADALHKSYTITVRRSKGGYVSEYILDNWKEGTEAVISGPQGDFYYLRLRDAKHIVAMAGGSVIAAYSENCAWVRGSISASFKAEAQLLCPDDRTKYFTSERLMRYALSHLGFSVLFEKENAQSPSPVIMTARNNNAYMYSVFMPDTTVKAKLKTDIGCPIIKGYETVIENGYSTYHFPRAFHGECRFFVEQESGVVSARELPHISRKFRRKLIIDGLNNATVRVFVEKYCVGNAKFVLNEPEYTGEKFEGKWVSDEHGDYYEIKNITGTLRVSMPMKKTLPVVDFD